MLPYVRSIFVVLVVGGVAAACGSGDSSGIDFGETDAATTDGGGNDGRGSSGSSGSSSGSSGSSSGESGSGSGSGSSSGGSGSSSGSSGSSSGGGTCGSCTTDSECESSCPPVQGGGTNCCDTGSGVCYATTQSSCPSPVDSGSGG